jgi:polyhydroxybutyrate depolymerase
MNLILEYNGTKMFFPYYAIIMNSILKISFLTVLLIFSCGVYSQYGKTSEFQLNYDGYSYRYLMFIPQNYSFDQTWPLVIAFHGTNGTPESISLKGFTQLAEEKGFIVVYPKSRAYTWNILIPNFDPSIYNNDDAGFIAALIDTLVMKYNVNNKRVYLAGLSQGGFMAFCMAFKYPSKITAIGAIAGRSVNNIYTYNHPLPFIYFHAADDNVVPITAYGSQWGITIPNVDDMIASFAQINQCTELPEIILDANGILGRIWLAPETAADIVYYRLNSGGHSWFNEQNNNLNATKLIWDFFATHPVTSFSSMINEKKGNQLKLNIHGNTIQYVINSQEDITLIVNDILGKEMMRKTIQNQPAGTYEFTFEKNRNGGLYLVTLVTRHYKITQKF